MPVPDLPIFTWQRRERAWFYAPGYLVVAPEAQARRIEQDLRQETPQMGAAAALHAHARGAQTARAAWQLGAFTPLCLTVYLNRHCNLNCSYCFAQAEPPQPNPGLAQRISLEAVRMAAQRVAQNCQSRQAPFWLALHGGGEPTLDWRLAEQILQIVEEIARQAGLPVLRYIATNGVMSGEVAGWLVQRFDLIGLSCDGPPHIQDVQRPLRNGAPSSPYVERLAEMVHAAGKPLQVRVTLTPHSMTRQEEIAHYLCTQLRPEEIRAEPVYQGGRAEAQSCLGVEMVETYVHQFRLARGAAAGYGVKWTSAGTRLGSVYGPYCHIFRQVLNLLPGDTATACFRHSALGAQASQAATIGWYDPQTEACWLDETRIQAIRQAMGHTPRRCATCFSQYHCTLGCPDRCPLEPGGEAFSPAAEFRCQLQTALALTLLDELVPVLDADKVYSVSLDAQRLGEL